MDKSQSMLKSNSPSIALLISPDAYRDALMVTACENGVLSDVKYICSIYQLPKDIIQKCISYCTQMTKNEHCMIMVYLMNEYSLLEDDAIDTLEKLDNVELLSELCSNMSSLYGYVRQSIIACIFPALCSLRMENDIANIYGYLSNLRRIELIREILDTPNEWPDDYINFNLENASIFNLLPKDLSDRLFMYCLSNKKCDALIHFNNSSYMEAILFTIHENTNEWTTDFTNEIMNAYIKKGSVNKNLIKMFIASDHVFDKPNIHAIVNDIYWKSGSIWKKKEDVDNKIGEVPMEKTMETEFNEIIMKFIPEIVEWEISLKERAYNLIKSNKELSSAFNSTKNVKQYYVSAYSFDELLEIIVSTDDQKMFCECVTELMKKHNDISVRKLAFYNHPLDPIDIKIDDETLRLKNYKTILEKKPIVYNKIVRFATTFSKNIKTETLEEIIQNEQFPTITSYDAFAMLELVKNNFELAKTMIGSHEFYIEFMGK